MNPLETELRATLHAHADQIPAGATTRLRRIDYHPRTHRLQPRIAVGGGVVTAGATTAAILSLTGGASTAFAGWSAQPTKPTPAQIADAERVCSTQIPIKGLPLVLSDTRGPFTFRIYANSDTMTDCTVGPSFTHASGVSTDGPIAPPAGQAKLGVAHVTTRDGKAYSFSQGSVGDGVTGVTLHLADGSTVTATVQGGWYVAWWPGSTALATADVTTTSGTHTQAFHEKPCPAGADCQATEGSGRGTVTGFSSVGQ